jgi:thiol-disulfide isomerase/thioredoxin
MQAFHAITVSCAAFCAASSALSALAAPPEPTTQTVAPARLVEPRANSIIERGIAAAKSLETLEVVSYMTLEGPGAADAGQAPSTPARWIMDFRGAKDDAPFVRVAIESLQDGEAVRRVNFNGTEARSADLVKKTYMVGEFRAVGDQSTMMPGWFVDNRLGMAPVGGGPDDMRIPPLVDARMVGEETLDGTACDLVRSTRAKLLPALDAPDGAKIPAREMRIVETVAYARADGLPRRATIEIQLDGVPSDGIISVATFTGVKPNPTLDDDAFATGPIDGYQRVEPPTQMKRSETGFKVKTGDAAPAFALKDAQGREVTLESLKGRVVVLDFWATWCGPCKAAMPAIQKIHESYANEPVSVFGINVSERKPEAGAEYFKEKKYTYGCLLAGESLANDYGVSGIPTLVVIGKDGKIALLEMGFSPEGEQGLRLAIDAALGK